MIGIFTGKELTMDSKPLSNLSGGTTIKRIDHIGIAVKSLDKALHKWEALLGVKAQDIEILKEHFTRVAFLSLGGVLIEMLEPWGEKPGVIGEFLEKHGEGFHHIAYRVENLEALLTEIKRKGISLSPIFHKTYSPFQGTRGSLIAFLNNEETNDVLIELVEIRNKK